MSGEKGRQREEMGRRTTRKKGEERGKGEEKKVLEEREMRGAGEELVSKSLLPSI